MDTDFALAAIVENFTNCLLKRDVVLDANILFMISSAAGSITAALVVLSGCDCSSSVN